jgi:hypothetical protein
VPKSLLQALQIGRYRITLRCTSPLEFDGFVGSELRGAFGSSLHDSHCVDRSAERCTPGRCLECACLYGTLFDPLSASLKIVRPFVIAPLQPTKLKYEAAEELQFDLLLMGRALGELSYCITAWEALGRRGIGQRYRQGWGRFEIAGIAAGRANAGAIPTFSPLPISTPMALRPDHSCGENHQQSARDFELRAQRLSGQLVEDGQLSIDFLTPTEIRKQGAPLRVLDFPTIWDSLTTRLQNMVMYHSALHRPATESSSSELQTGLRAAKAMALAVRKIEDNSHWQTQQRHSSSQHRTIEMGGLMGQMTFAGDFTPLLPLLVIGEWLHIGKGCDMGNGRYRLV